ncbi:bolA-like protein DDB_G0274169 [Stomoxys calcitrans]|uniref:BolA-like protein DDB_G0274169 n=1 Tax=Stomoxys calcitrans TaxID=35570 RepID=A0A1I8PLQ4_STOCA|nr:bolA-like protein DDB_G0274169 [Stomoxys calcitrans]
MNITTRRLLTGKYLYPTLVHAMSTEVAVGGPVEKAIVTTLTSNLQPVHLQVVNESYMHNVPKGSETHFKVLVVSDKFEELPLIKRHRLVNNLLKEKLCDLFPHALSIEAKTPKQWTPSYTIEPSPNCRGGFGK